jgi:hypothetical protein
MRGSRVITSARLIRHVVEDELAERMAAADSDNAE